MKRTVVLLLAGLMMLAAFAAHAQEAPEEMLMMVVDITEGELLCRSSEGPTELVLTNGDTAYALERDLTVGSIIYVEAAAGSDGQIVAARIRDLGTLEGYVLEVDAEGGRLQVNDYTIGVPWVTVPEGDDAAAYAGQHVRFYPYGLLDAHFQEAVRAEDLRAAGFFEGAIAEIHDDYLIVTQGDESLRVNIDENTNAPQGYIQGMNVHVFYEEEPSGDTPPAVYGESVWVVNG